MLTTPEKFEIELNGIKMIVEELDLPGHTAFKIVFSSDRKPIIITRTHDFDRVFWTSISSTLIISAPVSSKHCPFI
jgi:hypothetical protein